MNVWISISIMAIVGAFIGGLTNSIAIRMLFRPFNTLYIGKYRVPFTPGLIPKRRKQLAVQLGETVTNHLLTAEGVQAKINDADFRKEMTELVQVEVKRFLKSDMTISELLKKDFGVDDVQNRIQTTTEAWLSTRMKKMLQESNGKEMKDILPEKFVARGEEKLPEVVDWLLNKGVLYLESEDGRKSLASGIDAFLMDKGMLVNMVSMFFGNVSIAEKVQPELIKFMKHENTRDTVLNLLQEEYRSFMDKRMDEALGLLNMPEMTTGLAKEITARLPIEEYLNTPVSSLASSVEKWIVDDLTPKAVAAGLDLFVARLEMLLEKMHLAKIVEEQVETFSLERLEEIIISIAKSELKMITWLGALLGGVIGVFQGILVLFL
ncbi:DUF445 domain-containing protein [Fictibacillus sp. 5RED26]|uniref:DUF445 domain-containing protein n=1 Tax=unclassified Fictibacillus TaxID=2644029 RepID=UPI0018CD97E8|nr:MULTISPECIES: DUF445 family protein [unclassified Fictibacillus]MBH0154834.1 DUF445 domain-containing protein [Fictibacillus sp. 5RED26]MBH0165384.1 DUF445 domain-containing protein [Fictibacillus sp. 7GRE50]MBH0172023.1 DUF445 domain-containing protein [Fictibacillus sp. 23RED33]